MLTFAFAFGQITAYGHGEMVEWSITTVLKTVVPRGTGGSNPSLSASETLQRFNLQGFVRLVQRH